MMPVDLFNERMDTCPRRPVLDNPESFSYWLRAYKYLKRGFLPEPGSMMEQSAVALRVFDILDSVYASIEEAKQKQAQRKAWASGQGGQSGGPTRQVLTSRG